MDLFTRREFVRRTALTAASLPIASSLSAQARSAASPPSVPQAGVAPVRWLEQTAPAYLPGATWGVAWAQGTHAAGTGFTLRSGDKVVPVQSWPLATWPDGSLKWTAHALAAGENAPASFELQAGTPIPPATPVRVVESPDAIEVDTGVMQCRMARRGSIVIEQLKRGDVEVARQGRLVLLVQDEARSDAPVSTLHGVVAQATVESSGPVRTVVRVEGRHAAEQGGRALLAYVVRLYFYAGAETVRVMHTVIYDGDEKKDFVRGLGLRFAVPLRGPLHDRHVRFSGQEKGLFAEAVRGITGLRRDPGRAVREAQLAGRATPPVDTWARTTSGRLNYIPAYADWTLLQASCDGFEIRKRTSDQCTWLTAARGQRAGGTGFVGTPAGGLAMGIRNFWQSFPAQLDVRGATGEVAEFTAWLWAPDAGPMDLRGYHDGMGQDTYEKQLDALEITYEDYEPGFDRPDGVARTSEILLLAAAATPSRDQLAAFAECVAIPPQPVTSSEHLHRAGVFGRLWAPADRSTPARVEIEEQLDWLFRFYQNQQDERRWYGFWNFGDVMHSYDPDRREWRYDIGGYAWDNSELSTDIWLWQYFLHTGRADVFRFAEAMTRHTGEVDVHHQGRFAPLGSRHNVLHWGCSAKQLRISTALNRRFYYFLTADERVGDLMREQIEGARALAVIQANRKVARDRVTAPDPNAREVYMGFGTDWGSLAGAWLTEWERTGSDQMRERLITGMKTIAAQPLGFFTGGARMELATGRFALSTFKEPSVSHLSAVFGLMEVCAELLQLIDVPEFRRAWLDYCTLYNAPAEEQRQRFGAPLRGISLQQGHSRLTAFAARETGNAVLAQRAWKEFGGGEGSEGRGRRPRYETQLIQGPDVLRPVNEAAWVSTNGTAQWSLAAMQCLALVGDVQPPRGV